MPTAQINVLAGHPRAALRQALANVSAAMSTSLEATPDRLAVWINEVDPALWMVNGRTAEEALASWPRSEIEMPFVHVSVLEGRPTHVMMHLVREITEGVAHALGSKPERVRVVVHTVDPDVWGIGGVPASVLRAEELAARAPVGH